MRFFAFSMPACAVLLKMLYSRVAEVASSNALFASCCSHRTISSLPDSTDSTCAIRMPSIPRSLNSGERAARASLSPIWCSLSRNIRSPSLVLSFRVATNCSTSSPTVFAISSGAWKSFIIVLDRAEAAISTFWPLASSVAPNARISGIVMFAWAPTPARRCANSTRYGFDAVQF